MKKNSNFHLKKSLNQLKNIYIYLFLYTYIFSREYKNALKMQKKKIYIYNFIKNNYNDLDILSDKKFFTKLYTMCNDIN